MMVPFSCIYKCLGKWQIGIWLWIKEALNIRKEKWKKRYTTTVLDTHSLLYISPCLKIIQYFTFYLPWKNSVSTSSPYPSLWPPRPSLRQIPRNSQGVLGWLCVSENFSETIHLKIHESFKELEKKNVTNMHDSSYNVNRTWQYFPLLRTGKHGMMNYHV